jgi:hypothetical protein
MNSAEEQRIKQVRVYGDNIAFYIGEGKYQFKAGMLSPKLKHASDAERDYHYISTDGQSVYFPFVEEEIFLKDILELIA